VAEDVEMTKAAGDESLAALVPLHPFRFG
jgi:hypothetical protein